MPDWADGVHISSKDFNNGKGVITIYNVTKVIGGREAQFLSLTLSESKSLVIALDGLMREKGNV